MVVLGPQVGTSLFATLYKWWLVGGLVGWLAGNGRLQHVLVVLCCDGWWVGWY